MMTDYKCVIEDTANWMMKASEKTGIKLPEGYHGAENMAGLSKAIKDMKNDPFCILPFCHTVEGEAMGAVINYGDETTGPRVKEYRIEKIEDVLDIPPVDFEKGRIHEVLMAVKMLKDEGETVLLEITGPVTLLNNLLDAKYIFKALRRNRELMEKIFRKLEDELLRFVEKAREYGASIISYADSAGSLSIVGPKVMEDTLDMFTVDFLKRLEDEFRDSLTIHLCPKTALALTGSGRAHFEKADTADSQTYGDLIAHSIGRNFFLGDRCLNHLKDEVRENSINRIILD